MELFDKKNGEAAKASAPASASASVSASASAEALDEELIAVITAAIAVYENESDQYTQKLSIQKLDRRTGTKPAWGAMGLYEAIDARRI